MEILVKAGDTYVPLRIIENRSLQDVYRYVQDKLRQRGIPIYHTPRSATEIADGPCYVWNPQKGPPTCEHSSIAVAQQEAERLARRNIGYRFIVLRKVGQCIAKMHYPCSPETHVQWED